MDILGKWGLIWKARAYLDHRTLVKKRGHFGKSGVILGSWDIFWPTLQKSHYYFKGRFGFRAKAVGFRLMLDTREYMMSMRDLPCVCMCVFLRLRGSSERGRLLLYRGITAVILWSLRSGTPPWQRYSITEVLHFVIMFVFHIRKYFHYKVYITQCFVS